MKYIFFMFIIRLRQKGHYIQAWLRDLLFGNQKEKYIILIFCSILEYESVIESVYCDDDVTEIFLVV